MMSEKLFETALGIGGPWYVAEVTLDAPARTLTIRIDFASGSRFAVAGEAGVHRCTTRSANVTATSTRKGESLREKIEEQLAKLQQMPQLVRSFFGAPSVAYIGDW